ncbi:MAG: SecD/SecF family protein translocase subunit [Clostridia bacterium]|nr:SecD/SecF family protein translocase subunit [Clostridia bacterium]
MKAKKTGKWVFFVIFALILALTYTSFFGIDNYYGDARNVYFKGANDIRWGIDIRGGVEAVFSPDIKDSKITADDMAAAKAIIETRLVGNNITDYEVYTDNTTHQIIVRFPWSSDQTDFDPAKEVAKLGQTATLIFCKGSTKGDALVEGKNVASASYAYEASVGHYINLKFDSVGKAKFATATAANVGSTISIWMDDQKISEATVNEAITTGDAMITGSFTAEEASYLASQINAGALPFALTVDDSKMQIISPTLGSDALNVMLIAGSCAFALICLLMILRYRLLGGIASIALLGQVAAMIACISGYINAFDSFTLTIPGIAGIILSIGVGVDANVIAAERIREEFAKGKTIDGAIAAGYKNSLSAIIDGNVTIVIVSLVLMGAFGSEGILTTLLSPIFSIFGTTITGSIYSFGYTLLVGTIFNLILGVLCSRLMVKSISRLKIFRKAALYGGAKNV